MLLALAVSGWVAAALAVGLWLGERGRRMDAQRREGKIPVGRVKRARVTTPAEQIAAAVPAAVRKETEDARERYIDECVAEGYSREEASEDFDRMMIKSGSDELGVTA